MGKTEKLEILFRGIFPPAEWKERGGFLGIREGLLFGTWFPSPEGLAYYTLTVELPAGLKAISSAERLAIKTLKRRRIYTFILNHPAPPPPLVYGKYEYYYRTRGSLTVALYLKKPDPELAENYLKRSLAYIEEYKNLLGAFPYRRLSIVEISKELGEAYPTLIFFGERVLRLPFIPETSLPHEILHQWFGCGVYPRKANWSEGLVTYLGDWRQAEKRGKGVRYRKDLLIAHETWCGNEDLFPLSRFIRRTNRCAQAIGYGKGAFLFYMLEQKLGRRVFQESLREFVNRFLFKEADWDDLERTFSARAGHDLSPFFQEWVERKGEPVLHLAKRYLFRDEKGKYRLGLTLYQDPPFYRLRVPIVIKGSGKDIHTQIEISGIRKDFELSLNFSPEEVLLDPEYTIWRKLEDSEIPPTLGLILSSGGKVVISREKWPVYRPLVHYFQHLGYRVTWKTFTESELSNENVIFMGQKPGVLNFLFENNRELKPGFYLEVSKSPYYPGKALLFVRATEAEEIKRVLPRLEHLWRYKRLLFRQGRLLEKVRSEGENGIRLPLSTETTGLPLKDLLPLQEIIRRIGLYRVILIGEEHDRYEHHLTQLEIIRTLYREGHRLAIGLEMFQQPFQKYLDLFIAGSINEKEFLKKTEYFKRWRFDWKLYRPIVLFARRNGIPLVALNVPSELTKKVAQSGLEGLSLEEKASLPEMKLDNPSYRAYLFKIYQKHREFIKRFPKFEYFYEAQILWDEGMAEAAYRWLQAHPDYQLVILAGKGHIMYGFGIPSRLKRRGIRSLVTLVLGGNERISSGFADFILYPEPAKRPFTARLGVWIKKEKTGVKIVQVEEKSPAAKAGLKKGDIILRADGEAISGVEDLRLILTFKDKGDSVKITYLRGEKEYTTTVRFQ
ncbi:ChaN family lipoprotein [Thermosulfurimonas sp. F29]|uniref:ChaN family lipoprotein n=1 Tax=Thermosulfurimonas sp. F29 TaxID=2867247 RepID=UPI001C833F23|nr:ChaN family lipoprotein [Thermosulfurimonas sp. F29]MBX6423036.1 ChaN family lipoprotein [Thermosulfurimonas sp. F29]